MRGGCLTARKPRSGNLHVVVLNRYAGFRFIAESYVVGYDGTRNLEDKERGVTTESPKPPEPAETPEKQSSERVQLWLIVLAVIVLGGVVEVVIYGYLERPRW